MIDITFVTSRQWKFDEVAAVLCADDAPINLSHTGIDLDEIQSLDPTDVMTHKLMQAREHLDGALMIDDTSLVCEGLHGLPGTLVKHFLQTIGAHGIYEMCEAICPNNMRARVICMLGLRYQGEAHFFRGMIEGIIVKPNTESPNYQSTLFLDVFQPNGSTCCFAQMNDAEHAKYNHRVFAAQKMREFLLSTQ